MSPTSFAPGQVVTAGAAAAPAAGAAPNPAQDPAVVRALRRAAVQARHAPSVHNTQPWRFVLRPGALEVHADWTRQLTVLDPLGRQLLLSCGCAVLNARVSLAVSGVPVRVERASDSDRPSLVARLSVDTSRETHAELAALDEAVTERRTNRRRFAPDDVATAELDVLSDAARAEGAELLRVGGEDDQVTLAHLSQLADRLENEDPAYRAEMRRWTTDDVLRPDGVPAFAVPHTDGGSHDDVPLRDFDVRGSGSLPGLTESTVHQTLLLLTTRADTPAAWERAGEALERVLLELTRLGLAASPLTQIVEIPWTRDQLRQELRMTGYPHVLLRVGHAAPTPATRRRRLSELLTEQSS